MVFMAGVSGHGDSAQPNVGWIPQRQDVYRTGDFLGIYWWRSPINGHFTDWLELLTICVWPILKAYVFRNIPLIQWFFLFFCGIDVPIDSDWYGLIIIFPYFPLQYWNGHKLGDNHPHFWTNPSTLLASSHAPVTYLHTLLVTSQPYLPWSMICPICRSSFGSYLGTTWGTRPIQDTGKSSIFLPTFVFDTRNPPKSLNSSHLWI